MIPHQFGQQDDPKTKETAAACERLARSGKLLFIPGFCGFHYFSAAYSGLQEFGRFSARLPHGQQSSAAFLELGGNAMICRDTPQTLQTTRSTHICGMYTMQRRSSSVGWFRSAAKWSRNIGWPAHQPGASLYPGREGLHKTAIFNLPLCHFATLPLQRISSRM